MLKTLCESIYRINVRKNLWIQQFELCSTVANVNTENESVNTDEFLKKEDTILKTVNESNLTELKRHIKVSYAKAIISNRETHGPYKSLNDLISQNKIESDVLDELYHKCINYKQCSRRQKYKHLTIPELIITQIPNVTLGIHVGTNFVSWASVTNNFEVLEWNCTPWFHKKLPKSSYDIINLIGPIFKQLPTYNSYVLEDTGFRNVEFLNILYCQKKLTFAIMACLKLMESQSTNDSLEPVNTIFMLKPRTTAMIHGLIVGNEVVSTSSIMNKIINNNTIEVNNKSDVVSIHDVLKNNYLKVDTYQQEEMSWSLLKALTFMQVVQSFILSTKKKVH